MFGKRKELLPKDILVDLESDPKRADKMLELFVKGENNAPPIFFDEGNFMTASAFASRGLQRSGLEQALRQMELAQADMIRRAEFDRAAQMQNQMGGLLNGLGNQSLGTGLGGIFGNPRR